MSIHKLIWGAWAGCVAIGIVLILRYRPQPALYQLDTLAIRLQTPALPPAHWWFGIIALGLVLCLLLSAKPNLARVGLAMSVAATLVGYWYTSQLLAPTGEPIPQEQWPTESTLKTMFLTHVVTLPLITTVIVLIALRWRRSSRPSPDDSEPWTDIS